MSFVAERPTPGTNLNHLFKVKDYGISESWFMIQPAVGS